MRSRINILDFRMRTHQGNLVQGGYLYERRSCNGCVELKRLIFGPVEYPDCKISYIVVLI